MSLSLYSVSEDGGPSNGLKLALGLADIGEIIVQNESKANEADQCRSTAMAMPNL